MYKTLRLVLGDQLNHAHSWYQYKDKSVLYVMIEQRSETEYITQHIQKLVAFFTAMRLFAAEKQAQGFDFLYYNLDNENNLPTFEANITALIKKYNILHFEYQQPDEYRLDLAFQLLADKLENEHSISYQVYNTEHFLTSRDELARLFEGKKGFVMETFYRYMRKKHQILMEKDLKTPLTARWNYDVENRKSLNDTVVVPAEKRFIKPIKAVLEMINSLQIKTIGFINEDNFGWACNREEALSLLAHFVSEQLAHFGSYEDAMSAQHAVIFHSQLSFCMNVKLISPLEVIKTVERYYYKKPQAINIAQVEGFIRQVLGWREYVRGIYWNYAPDYKQSNYFNHHTALPSYFWTAKTDMNCLKHSLSDSLNNAYAHHIQRLMVIGNFSLLIGANPEAVNDWYLGVYADAIEWVQLPNTHGMSQYADGGLMATKPYTCGSNYINKMSDYCKGCKYEPKLKYGKTACPLNSLYWNFYIENQELLAKNFRLAITYSQIAKMETEEKEKITKQAKLYIENLEKL
jgi:deoxyribodipyrimidine photolyase-related protein